MYEKYFLNNIYNEIKQIFKKKKKTRRKKKYILIATYLNIYIYIIKIEILQSLKRLEK